jgi:beta-glucosidase/6-phospho-beta-glucosidase/beta-galactosidase
VVALELVGAFESTYLPAHDIDIVETSGHAALWREDLARLRACGVTRLRYPVRWHRIERVPGRFDWSATDQVLGHLRDEGMRPIVDLVHHTSYPRWLTGGFADPRWGPAYLRYCEAFARRYPWVEEYTLFNEPFATLWLAGHEGIWPPYGRGVAGFLALLRNVVPPLAEVSRRYAELLPRARHVYVDTCEGHGALDASGEDYAAMANDRRFLVLDLMLGRLAGGGPRGPFAQEIAQAGGEELLETAPGRIDVLGLDYYAHSEWAFTAQGGETRGVTPSPDPQGLAELVRQYHAHAPALPLELTETNVRGAPFERATWLKHTLEQCEAAVAAGAPLTTYCWFPFVDSVDWNSLLARADGCIDPVGVLWLDADGARHESSMSRAYAAAAAGARAAALPAYPFTPALARRLAGLAPLMEHFDWQDPPTEEIEMSDDRIVRLRAIAERAA